MLQKCKRRFYNRSAVYIDIGKVGLLAFISLGLLPLSWMLHQTSSYLLLPLSPKQEFLWPLEAAGSRAEQTGGAAGEG